MKKDLYRSALTESWQFIWQHKILWVLGLFATFLGQVGIEEVFARTNILYWDTGNTLNFGSVGTLLSEFRLLMESIPSAQTWLALIWLVVMVGGLLFFILFLALVSQGALIHTVAQSLIKKKKKIDFSKAWHIGVYHSGRLFFLAVVRFVLLSSFGALIGWFAYQMYMTHHIVYVLGTLTASIATIFVGLCLYFLNIYAASYIIIDHKSIKESVVSAWELFIKHKVVSFEVGLLQVILNVVLTIVALAGAFIFFLIPTILVWFLSAGIGTAIIPIGTFVGIMVTTCFILLIGAIYTTFITAVWTNLFLHMHKKGIVSRMGHALKTVFAK